MALQSVPMQKALATQQKLLSAGIELFAGQGYDATSMRQIEAHAGVQRNLVTYHFGNKETFWKSCVGAMFSQIIDAMNDVSPTDGKANSGIRLLIRQYLVSSASHPELMCIMLDESRRDEWRLQWLVDNYVRDFYDQVCDEFARARIDGVVPDISATQFYYLLVSSASVFTMAAERRLLAGPDAAELFGIDEHVEMITSLLTIEPKEGKQS